MSEFKTYHPIVNFIYFVSVIGYSCFFMHPICLCISLTCGFTYSVMLKGPLAIKTNVMYMLPVIIMTALINMVFNHEGTTILAYLPTGNSLTLESLIYGLCAALMIISVICHFSCYNEIMTSDKFIYLFGKIMPALSLIFSMTLRFVPKFLAQLKVVINAQKCMGRDMSRGSLIKRVKGVATILSVMVTWSLENAIETADCMKSRGYGVPGRTAFSVFVFGKRDKMATICLLVLSIYTLVGQMTGGMGFSYFPVIQKAEVSAYGVSVFIAYLLLCMYPIMIELWGVRKWRALRSKI